MIPTIPELLTPSQHGAVHTHCAECEALLRHLNELESLGLDVSGPRQQLEAIQVFFGTLRQRLLDGAA